MPATILQSMLRKVMAIEMSNLPQQTKDSAKREYIKGLEIVLQESDPAKINRLVMDELRKKQVEKLK